MESGFVTSAPSLFSSIHRLSIGLGWQSEKTTLTSTTEAARLYESNERNMARGAEAKLRRRNRKKDEAAEAGDDNDGFDGPVSLSDAIAPIDEDSNMMDNIVLPKQKKKKKKKSPTTNGDGDYTGDDDSMPPIPASLTSSSPKGIKTTPLILLILMVGTTLLPALIYAGDFMAAWFSKNSGSIGYRLGLGAVPKKRVVSFYEKHAPEKLSDVPSILSKHYGDYPRLIKKLERKYQDYGYFMGWQDDEAPLTLALAQVESLYTEVWLAQYWNRYAPQAAKTAFRNIRYNLTYLGKRGRRLWKKHAWPLLEPILGVPEGAEKQKRKDAAEARKRANARAGTGGASTTRRRNREYRDEEDE